MRRLRLGIRTGCPWGQILSQPQVLSVSGFRGGIPGVRPRQRAPTGAPGMVGAAGTPGLGWSYPYLCMRSLKDCRLTALCVNYGIVVAIVLYVVVVRDLADCFVVAYREDFMW